MAHPATRGTRRADGTRRGGDGVVGNRRDFVKSAGAVAAAAAGAHPGRVFAAPVAQAEETIKIVTTLLPTP